MAATRRGFLGALLGGAAATAGGVLIPKAVAAEEKIEVSATKELAESLREAADGEIVACEAGSLPDEFFNSRTNLYREWWNQASPQMWRMSQEKYEAFIEAHMKVNSDFGIKVELKEGPHVEGDAGMLTPYSSVSRWPNEAPSLGNAEKESPVSLEPKDEYI